MESIEALLTALKQHEGNAANLAPLAGPSTASSLSGLADAAGSDDPSQDPSQGDSEDDESGNAAQNAKIVSALESQYPKTYAKIVSELGNGDEPDDSQSGFPGAKVS